jgi:dolichol-phosphate hexosyltransferase
MRGSLLVPTLDEAGAIGTVLRQFRAASEEANSTLFRDNPIDWEILVIDGASTDGTGEVAAGEGARVIVERRRGYGRAYRTGFAAAQGDVIATMDGDGTYPGEEIPRLVRMLLDEGLDFVTTDRLAGLEKRSMTVEHRIGNWVLNTFLRIAYAHYLNRADSPPLRDSQSGMWVFRRSVLEKIRITQDGMPMSEELKLEVILNGLRFKEVPIRYAERWAGPPKLSSYRDGRANLEYLLAKRFQVAKEHGQGRLFVGDAPARPSDRPAGR